MIGVRDQVCLDLKPRCEFELLRCERIIVRSLVPQARSPDVVSDRGPLRAARDRSRERGRVVARQALRDCGVVGPKRTEESLHLVIAADRLRPTEDALPATLQRGQRGSAPTDESGDALGLHHGQRRRVPRPHREPPHQSPIDRFGANPYTEEESKTLTEIITSFNARHGTEFSEEDYIRLEAVNNDILDDDV